MTQRDRLMFAVFALTLALLASAVIGVLVPL